jgi:phage terminase large subunit GpA-like protein
MGKLLAVWGDAFLPPPAPLVSEWADANRFLSEESSAEPGRFRTDRAPYQRGIMDARLETGIHTVVVVSSAQVGKSEMLLTRIGYVADVDPAPCLLVQPTVQMSEEFSRERIATMIRDTPALASKIAQGKTSGNTLLKKEFPGGYLAIVGANSPAGLASRPVRELLFDEVDRYPLSASGEGDPITVAMKRTTTFWNRTILMVSTPTFTRTSRILKAWDTSDKRRYLVPCPHCGEMQHLVWEQVHYPHKGALGADPEQAVYQCIHCSEAISPSQKTQILALGKWVATEPNPKVAGVAGFHLNELYSPWKSWADIGRDYEVARTDPLQLQVWTNTSLGLGWESEATESLEWEHLSESASQSGYCRREVPVDVRLLTAGVDVQANRLEVSVWGWAAGETGWLIDHQVIMGEPTDNLTWSALDDYLAAGFIREGDIVKPKTVFVDSGNWTREVYGQVRIRRGKGWHAIKGAGGSRRLISPATPQEVGARGKAIQRGVKLLILGVDMAKDTLHTRSKLGPEHPKRLNFPSNLDLSYFEAFASEIKVLKHKVGQAYFQWEKLPGINSNEAWDCAIYAYCAAVMAGLERLTSRATIKPASESTNSEATPEQGEGKVSPAPKIRSTQRRVRRPPDDERLINNWLNDGIGYSRNRNWATDI